MLTIRLQRVGRKNDPSFRVILVESKRAAKTGNYQEMLGSYDPRTNRVDLKADRIKYWLSQGTTISDTMHNLLVSQKVIEGKKINVLPRKSPPNLSAQAEKEEAVAAAVAAAPVAEATPEAAPEEASPVAEQAVSNDVAVETPAQ